MFAGRTPFVLLFALLVTSAARAADPTDNPIATYYSGPEGYPAWTDDIHWSRVINMKKYPKGKTEYEKFVKARDELSEGGGVLYYPAGTYNFATTPPGIGLMLVPGVVIRGDAPAGHPLAAEGKLDPPTKFVFAFRKRGGGQVPADWNFIGLQADDKKNVKNVGRMGIAWVHLVGATVAFGPQLDWGKTWGSANSLLSDKIKKPWAARQPSGTHPIDALAGGGQKYVGAGSGRLVFGCSFDDAAVLDDYTDPGYGPDGFHTSMHCARVIVYGSRIFVANNLLPKSRKNFSYRQKTSKQMASMLFDYGKTCGIDINRELLANASMKGTCPGYFGEGIVVRDNFVYNHGHKGFSISGNWVSITGNNNDRTFLRHTPGAVLTMNGYDVASARTDTMSGAFDLAGRNLWADRNRYTNTGSSPGLEGDGIIGGAAGGTPIFSWALTHNVGTRGGGSPGSIGGRDVDCHGLLVGWNTTGGAVGCIVDREAPKLTDCAIVANKAARVSPDAKTIERLEVKSPLTAAATPILTPPTDVKAAMHDTDAVDITWSGGANAVGIRVERKIAGGKWQAIAYRPPQVQGDPENPRQWIDFTAPTGKELVYRVVALDADDSDKAASAATPPLTLPRRK